MASLDRRRTAADARRIADIEELDKATTEKLREALGANYVRGREAGRAELMEELEGVDGRTVMLETSAELMDLLHARTSSIANSTKACAAYKECAAILRDAAKGEAPPEPQQAKRTTTTKRGKGKKKG